MKTEKKNNSTDFRSIKNKNQHLDWKIIIIKKEGELSATPFRLI